MSRASGHHIEDTHNTHQVKKKTDQMGENVQTLIY